MAFDLMEYKLKHIVRVKEGLIERKQVLIPIGDKTYYFRIEEVKSELIEIIDFFRYIDIKLAEGPLEAELKDFTYGKTRKELSDNEVYMIRFSKFKMEVNKKDYEFEISGVGPKALKISLYLKYIDIEKAENYIERKLKEIILNQYTPLFEYTSNQEKLKEIKKEFDKQEANKARIQDEVRWEQEEKERKWRELEERLNSNKPKERTFKRY